VVDAIGEDAVFESVHDAVEALEEHAVPKL
jgi:hypothetical protein